MLCFRVKKTNVNSNKLVNLSSCSVDWWFQKSLEASCFLFTSYNYLMLFSIGHIIIICIFVSVCSFILNTLYFTLNLLHMKLISVLFGISNIITQIYSCFRLLAASCDRKTRVVPSRWEVHGHHLIIPFSDGYIKNNVIFCFQKKKTEWLLLRSFYF